MTEPVILTFDVGTQSTRGVLVDQKGGFISSGYVRHDIPYYSENPGWAEQDPDFYYKKICQISRQLQEEELSQEYQIIAVTVSTMRDTAICLDKSYKPLRDAILWLDKRKAQYISPGLVKRFLLSAVGMGKTIKTIYQSSVCNWIMQNEPEIWERTEKYVLLSTYLNYRLTGMLKDSAAGVIGHVPLDYKNRKWMEEGKMTRFIYDVPKEKLCELCSSGEVIGRITKKASLETGITEGTPLIATGSDKGCETIGLSVLDCHKAAVSFGTTATIQMSLKDFVAPQRFMPAYPGIPNHIYNPEIEIYRGCWLISWFIKEFGEKDSRDAMKMGISTEELIDSRIEDIPPGCEGLLLHPFWTPGILNPYSLGSVIGFSDCHTRYHLYRAIIEGLGFELYSSLKSLEKRAGTIVHELYVGGGGSKSSMFCQITADIFGIPVKRTQTHEVCSVGAAMTAFIGMKMFVSYAEAIKNMVHDKDVFYPDPERHRDYMGIYHNVYRRTHGRLRPLNKELYRLTERV